MVQAKDAYDLLSKEGCSDDFGNKEGVGGCEQLSVAPAPVASPTNKPTKKKKTKKPKKSKKKKKTAPPTPSPTDEPTWAPTNTDFPTYSTTDSGTATSTLTDTYSSTAESTSFDCVNVQIIIRTDNYPEDTSFKVLDINNEVVMFAREDTMKIANYFYSFDKCLEPGCYKFQIKDAWGDGLCCDWGNGEYQLLYDGYVESNGKVFTDQTEEYFGDC